VEEKDESRMFQNSRNHYRYISKINLRDYRYIAWLGSKVCNCIRDMRAIAENLLYSVKSKRDLIIIDDIFPHLLSAFKIAEFNCYLGHFKNVIIRSTGKSFPAIKEKRSFRKIVKEYENIYPQFKGKARRYNRFNKLKCKLVYVIFLKNAYDAIDKIDESKTPFVFTLYPGSFFELHQINSDKMLSRVLASPNLKKIIVTQKITHQYLTQNNGCPEEKIKFIYGAVIPMDKLVQKPFPKKYYPKNKDSFDICFVAMKYMPEGRDKGYNIFIEVAKRLAVLNKRMRFHVVGPWTGDDIDISPIQDRLEFYGSRFTDFFPEFYSRMDIILSPNAPFILLPGAFDGFPTASCIEAGVCGVAVFCTDILNLNMVFRDREEIVIIPKDASSIADIILEYFDNLNELYGLANMGKNAFRRYFGYDYQMKPRMELLSQCMSN